MSVIEPVGGVGGTHTPQESQKAQKAAWEKKILSGYMQVIALLESILDGVYIPGLKNANLMAQGAKAIYQFLSENPKLYMHDIDKVLTHFLNGWNYFEKYAAKLKKEHKPVPVFLQKILDNPTFKQLAGALTDMAYIEKHNPHYKTDPKWKSLEEMVVGKGGILDQLNALGTKDQGLVGQAEIFAEITGSEQQTIYAMAKVELKRWDSMVKMASTLEKRFMSIAQFITGTTLS